MASVWRWHRFYVCYASQARIRHKATGLFTGIARSASQSEAGGQNVLRCAYMHTTWQSCKYRQFEVVIHLTQASLFSKICSVLCPLLALLFLFFPNTPFLSESGLRLAVASHKICDFSKALGN